MICSFRRNLEMAMVMICVQFFNICKQIQWLDCSRCRYMYESLRTPTPRRNDSQAVWHNEFRAKSLIWRWQGEEYSLHCMHCHSECRLAVPYRDTARRIGRANRSGVANAFHCPEGGKLGREIGGMEDGSCFPTCSLGECCLNKSKM